MFLRWGAPVLALLAVGCGDNVSSPPSESQPVETVAADIEAIDPDAAFFELVEQHAYQMLAVSPELASGLGLTETEAGDGFGARFGGYGFAASQRAREMNERFLQDLHGVDVSALTGDALITYEILKDAYRIAARRNEFDFGGASEFGAGRPNSGSSWAATPYMVTQLTGPHLFLPRLLQTQHPIRSQADVEDFLARLDDVGRVMDEVVETVNADAGVGVTPPDFVLAGAINAINGLIASPAGEHPIVNSLISRMADIETLSDEERSAYATAAEKRVEAVVYTGYSRLKAALENLVEQAGSDAGIWRLGAVGEQYYQFTLDAYGGGGMTGEEIHALGLAEVARISAEMDALLKSIGLVDGSVAARMALLGKRDDNLFPDTDEGRAALLSLLREQVAAVNLEAPKWFGVLPNRDVEVRRIPVYEQDSSPGGYYSGPSLDGERPGIYWINLKSTHDNPIHSLKTLTYHEAVPGHHFQISAQRSSENMPLIRNMLSYSGYTEGWALYAEALAKEMGMYKDDPEGDLGRLQAELFRAARLVVDSGLHAKRWSREEAIDYMIGATGETRASITREIERYSAVPGQACSYKLGMLKMQALRAEAEEALGDQFDIREFHDVVLETGAAPLGVLELHVRRWLAEKQE